MSNKTINANKETGELGTIRMIVFLMNLELIMTSFSLLALITKVGTFRNVYHLIYYVSLAFSVLYIIRYVIKHNTWTQYQLSIAIVSSIVVVVSFITMPSFFESFSNASITFVLFFAVCMPLFILSSRVRDWRLAIEKAKHYVLFSACFSPRH